MKINLIIICFMIFTWKQVNSNGQYKVDGMKLIYKCIGNEDLDFHYNYKNGSLSSMIVSNCNVVNITHDLGVRLTDTITSIKVDNVTKLLQFEPNLSSVCLENIELLNIGYLSEISSEHTFDSFLKIHHFHIKNSTIGRFAQSFLKVNAFEFILENVTISNLEILEFSGNSTKLKIINSYINVTTREDPLSFENFGRVEIINTTFQFPYGGKILIFGTNISLLGNIFLNGSVNVEGKNISLTNNCTDGRGSVIQLNSTDTRPRPSIISCGNRVTKEIDYGPHIKHNCKGDNDIICPGAKSDCLDKKQIGITPPSNHGETIHQGISCVLFFHIIIIASAVVTRI